jgi:hypothetical protein
MCKKYKDNQCNVWTSSASKYEEDNWTEQPYQLLDNVQTNLIE